MPLWLQVALLAAADGPAVALMPLVPVEGATKAHAQGMDAELRAVMERFDFLELYLPINPFHSLANSVVPAVVLFSIAFGVALIGVPGKQRLICPFCGTEAPAELETDTGKIREHDLARALREHVGASQAARIAASLHGVSRRDVYRMMGSE